MKLRYVCTSVHLLNYRNKFLKYKVVNEVVFFTYKFLRLNKLLFKFNK